MGSGDWTPGLWGQPPGHGQQLATGTLPRNAQASCLGVCHSLSQSGPVCGCKWTNVYLTYVSIGSPHLCLHFVSVCQGSCQNMDVYQCEQEGFLCVKAGQAGGM